MPCKTASTGFQESYLLVLSLNYILLLHGKVQWIKCSALNQWFHLVAMIMFLRFSFLIFSVNRKPFFLSSDCPDPPSSCLLVSQASLCLFWCGLTEDLSSQATVWSISGWILDWALQPVSQDLVSRAHWSRPAGKISRKEEPVTLQGSVNPVNSPTASPWTLQVNHYLDR